MSCKLWKATFTPAYPVCEGELILLTPSHLQEEDALVFANQIITAYGRPSVHSLDYLGDLIPSTDFLEQANESYDGIYIISIQTGEY